jgi:CDP-glycerol glycerophosphotransferase
MHEDRPIVSIFLPVYNGEAYLAQTLDALMAQTYSMFEVVIVDDGSTDGTRSIADEYARRDSRFRVVAHEKNLGHVAGRNTGWRACRPDTAYLINHDSDDISLPAKLATLVDYLESHRRR